MTSHRPYPAPASPHVMHMSWHDLLFMHWRVPAEALRPHIPAQLSIDTFDGSAWIAVVPFYMRNTRPRYTFNVPGLSNFAELNVRTYVTANGRPGVWFFSLDAESPFAVRIARSLFKLPYMDAAMKYLPLGDGKFAYASHRTHHGELPAEFRASYQPCGPVFSAQPGTLEYFLTARYCLYSGGKNGPVLRGEIDHADWPLQPAQASVECNTMTEQINLKLPSDAPHLLFVQQIDVVAWLPQVIRF